MSLEFEILMTVEEFTTILKWSSHLKRPTEKELNILKKIEFIIENLNEEAKDNE